MEFKDGQIVSLPVALTRSKKEVCSLGCIDDLKRPKKMCIHLLVLESTTTGRIRFMCELGFPEKCPKEYVDVEGKFRRLLWE